MEAHPPVSLRYTDAGPPARIDVVNGRLRGVLENTSSARYKREIAAVSAALPSVLKLRPVEFTWAEEFGGGRDVGLVAEEVALVVPAVTSGADGRADAIRYSGIAALLVRSVQEQQEMIRERERQLDLLRDENDRREQEIEDLRARLDRLEKSLEE